MSVNSAKSSIKKLLLGIIFIMLVASNAITLKLYLDNYIIENKQIKDENIEDEITRTKYFIIDWYDELIKSYDSAKIYLNEIRFNSGQYTLTVSADRIRAVYPRGVRFFQLEYIKFIEFKEQNGTLYCHVYYDENEEKMFNIN